MPLDPKKRDGLKKGDQEFLRIIDEFGWHVMSVAPRKGGEGDLFSYSTGLYYHFQHPEIIIFNQRTDLRHNMVNNIGRRAKAGEKFEPGKGYSDIIGDYDNDETSFPLLQCFYPDKSGKFPWEPGCEQWAIDNQPQLDKPKNDQDRR